MSDNKACTRHSETAWLMRRPPKLCVQHIWERDHRPERSYAWYERHILCVGRILFDPPRDGKMYTKREALRHISKTTKYSSERGAMIRFMVDEGYAPCSAKCLYQLTKRVEEKHLPIGSNEWDGRCQNTQKASAREGEIPEWSQYIPEKGHDKDIFPRQKYQQSKTKQWNGRIVFRFLIPVSFGCDLDLFFKKETDIDGSIYYGKARKHMKTIDICSYIGSEIADEELFYSDDRIFRLYFDQETYTPPENIDEAGSSSIFEKLRNEIRAVSQRYGSCVICKGNGNNHNEKVFICLAKHKGTAKCPFRFTVRWDKHGYYIHLMARPSVHCNGCPFHLCKG